MVQVSLSTSTNFDGDLNALVEDQGTALTVRLDLDEPAPPGGLKVYIDSGVEQILNRLDLPGAIANPQFENLNLLATQTNFDNSGLAVEIAAGATFATITLNVFDNPEPDTFLPATFDGLVETTFSLLTADQIAAEDQSSITGIDDYTIAPSAASSTVIFVDDASQLPTTPEPPAAGYDEAVNGDISDNPNSPLELPLEEGTTRLSATTGSGDQEYVTVTVPEGFQLDSLVLDAYSVGSDTSFIGVQEGTTFTEPLDESANTGNILGYTLFGQGQASTDILDNIGSGAGAIGFDGSLPSGTYTFALQQLGTNSNYTLAFNVSAASTEPPTEPPSGELPVVSFVAIPDAVSEEAADAQVVWQWTVTGDFPEDGIVINLDTLGENDVITFTEQFAADRESQFIDSEIVAFDESTGRLQILLSSPNASFVLPILNDILEEGAQTFDFQLAAGEGYTVDPVQSATLLTITDDNGGPGVGPTVGLAISGTNLAEGDPLTVTFTVDGEIPPEGVQVLVQSPVFGALGQFDLADLGNITTTGIEGLPTVGDGGGSSFFVTLVEPTATISLNVFDDILAEEPLDITFTLANGELYEVAPDAGSVTLTVSDEPSEAGPTVGIALDKTNAVEGESIVLSFTVEGDIPEGGLTVLVNDVNSAQNGLRSLTEFDVANIELSEGIVGFPTPAEGDSGFFVTLTEPTASITLPVLDDGADENEASESFTFEVIDGEGYEVAPDAGSVTLNIADAVDGGGGGAPVVSFGTDVTTLTESENTVVTFSFTVEGDIPEGGLPVSLGVDADDSKWFFDFNNASRPSVNPDTGSFSSVTFLGGNVMGIAGGRVISQLMPPNFDMLNLVLTENTASFELEIFDDDLAEMAENIVFTLEGGAGYAIADSVTPVTLTLQDSPEGIVDATTPIVSLTTDRTAIAEGELLTVTLSVAGDIPAGGLEVFVGGSRAGALGEFAVSELETTGIEGSPGPNTDASGFVVTLIENQATITLPVFKDGLGEGVETLDFRVANGELYAIDPVANEVTLTIEETPPVISVNVLGGVFDGSDLLIPNLIENPAEGSPVLSLVLRSDAPIPEEGLVVNIGTDLADLTEFFAGSNFVPTGFGGQVLGAIYDADGKATGIQVRMDGPNAVINFADGLGLEAAGPHEVNFSVEAGENYTPSTNSASITVYDTLDQVPEPTSIPEIGLSIDRTTPLSEGSGAVTLSFTVTGEIPPEGVITYVSTGERAGLGDFDLLNAGVAGGVFPSPDGNAGGFYFKITEPTASITLQAAVDEEIEGIEDVTVALQPLTGYTIADGAGEATVLIRDGRSSQIQVSVEALEDVLIEAEGTLAVYTFNLSASPIDGPLTIAVEAPGLTELDIFSLQIENGGISAIRPGGFDLTIFGQSATVSIPVVNDGVAEGLEEISFTVLEGEGYQIAPDGGTGSFTIVDTADQVPAPPVEDVESNDTIATSVATGLSADNPLVSVDGAIAFNFQNNREVDQTEDVDLYSFELAAGDTVRLDIDANQLGSDLDPVLRLFDADGNALAQSDDDFAPNEVFASGSDSYLEYTAETAGTYYVGVSSYPNGEFDFENRPYDPNVAGSGTGRSSGTYSLNLLLNQEIVPEPFVAEPSTGEGPTVSLSATPGTYDGDDNLLANALVQSIDDGASILTLGLTVTGTIPEEGLEVVLTSDTDLSSIFETGGVFSPGAEVLGAAYDDTGAPVGLRLLLTEQNAIANLNVANLEEPATDGPAPLTFTLQPRAGYSVGDDTFSTMVYDTLAEVPTLPTVPEVSLSLSETALVESAGNQTTLTFNLSEAPPADGVLVYVDSGVRAALGEFDVLNAEITGGSIPAPNFSSSGFYFRITEETASITLSAFDETMIPDIDPAVALEGIEELTFTVQPGVGYAIAPNAGAVSLTIADNPDSVPLPDDGENGDGDGGPTIPMETEFNDTIADANPIELPADGSTVVLGGEIGTTRATRNLIDASEDVDMYAFELEAGQTLTIDIDAGGTGNAGVEGSLMDSVLRIFDADGNEVAISDNDGAPDEVFQANGDSYIQFTAAEAGTYYAGVSTLGNDFYDSNVAGSGSGWIFPDSFEPGPYRLAASLSNGDGPISPGPEDPLLGTDAADALIGTNGDDLLNGLLGSDTYTGGAGADQFVFALAQGIDTITDFEVGTDQISLGGLTPEGVKLFEVGTDTLVLTNSDELLGVVQGVTGLNSSVFA